MYLFRADCTKRMLSHIDIETALTINNTGVACIKRGVVSSSLVNVGADTPGRVIKALQLNSCHIFRLGIRVTAMDYAHLAWLGKRILNVFLLLTVIKRLTIVLFTLIRRLL